MKTIDQIQDEYAIKQGYESWEDLLDEFVILYYTKECNEKGACNWVNNHIKNVTDLIQEELKERIAEELIWMENPELIKEILNTENIK